MERRVGGSDNRYNLQQLQSSESEILNVQRNNIRYRRIKRRYGDIKSWEYLEEGPLQDIFNRLNIVDYLRAGLVCKRWNLLSTAAKQHYLESKPPFVVHASIFARKRCSLVDISSGTKFIATLPYFARQLLIGVSRGYLIMEDMSRDVLLVNPLTKKEHHLTRIPRPTLYFPQNRSVILFNKPHQDVFLVVLNTMNRFLRFCSFKGGNWNIYSFSHKSWLIIDIIFFQDKLLCLTNDSHIGTVDLEFVEEVTLLKLNRNPQLGANARFVTSDEELFVVDFIPSQRLDVFRINFEIEEWVKVDNLGDRAIFLCKLSCSLLEEPRRWGGYQNSLYYLHSSTACDVYCLNGQVLNSIDLQEVRHDSRINCWYLQHESLDIDSVLNGWKVM